MLLAPWSFLGAMVYQHSFKLFMISRCLLFLCTVRHLSLKQLYWRLRFVCLRRFWARIRREIPEVAGTVEVSSESLWALTEDNTSEEVRNAIASRVEFARRYAVGEFTFQNRTEVFSELDPHWSDPILPQLWRYHLHYFDYVDELMAWALTGKREDAFDVFKQYALSWIDNNRIVAGDAWHPYPLSLRIVNWANAVGFFHEELRKDVAFSQRLNRSLYGQTEILWKTLEFDVRGNHLLKNLKALIWAGLRFDGNRPEEWHRRGMEVLERELAEQVKADGGHFERCAGYHAIVLRDCLETAIWLERFGRSVPDWLTSAVSRMANYLRLIRRTDGQIPLFKDTAWDQSLISIDELLFACAYYLEISALSPVKPGQHAGYAMLLLGADVIKVISKYQGGEDLPSSVWMPDSGYGVVRDTDLGDYLIMDVGKPCPDYLPAHAHADLLSYELCVNHAPVIVDSGVYRYAAGPYRDFFRSTRAHNTVVVDGANQSEVWGSFRVGRRARPVDLAYAETANAVNLEGGHDGYKRLASQVVHHRRISVLSDRSWVVLDHFIGRGVFSVSSFLHFHPRLKPLNGDECVWGRRKKMLQRYG